MEVNRVPSGVFSSIIAGATATQGKNHSDLSQTCIAFLDTFKFPAFEILVVLQVVLPVIYSFLIPCLGGFCVEMCYSSNTEDNLQKMRRKTSSLLIETWAHWYFHWEICTWIWMVLAMTYLVNCPLNARYYEFTVGMSVVSLTVSCLSNLLSDYRLNLPKEGCWRTLFNISCCTLTSWLPRIFYPCCFDLYDLEPESQSLRCLMHYLFNPKVLETGGDELEMDVEPQLPPPSYAEAATEASTGSTTVAGSEPPTYTETISRIRKQLPKLSRSISVSAQKVGRQMSIKRNNPDSVVEAPMDLEGSVVTGGGSMKTKKKSPPPLIRWQS